MRSVVVVLPASMCAMMPMFLQRSNGTVLATAFSALLSGALEPNWSSCGDTLLVAQGPGRAFLPPVMREGLVGFRHAVHIFLLLDGGAAIVGRIQQLVGKFV